MVVRYEDLVTDPAGTIAPVWPFIGVDSSSAEQLHSATFAVDTSVGAGDHKSQYMNEFDESRIATGWRTPPYRLPDELRVEIEHLSTELGYPPLSAHHLMTAGRWPHPTRTGRQEQSQRSEYVGAIVARMRERLRDPPLKLQRLLADRVCPSELHLQIIGQEMPEVFDLQQRRVDDQLRSMDVIRIGIVTTVDCLRSLATGSLNPATALRRNDLNIVASANGERASYDVAVRVVAEAIKELHLLLPRRLGHRTADRFIRKGPTPRRRQSFVVPRLKGCCLAVRAKETLGVSGSG